MPHYTHHRTLCTSLIEHDVTITKRPEHEGDDYLLSVMGSALPIGDDIELSDVTDTKYLHTKRHAFASKNTDPEAFKQYIENRPSLRFLCNFECLDATIYTVAVERANNVPYEDCIKAISNILGKNPSSRRAVLRFMNPVDEYQDSVFFSRDVTCLSMIHFLDDHCKVVFRASDVANEILVDLLTINEFFISPVYNGKPYRVVVYASTAQGVEHFDETMNELSKVLDARCRL